MKLMNAASKGALALGVFFFAASESKSQSCIDTEIVFLADVSTSMTTAQREVQREGYAAAFRNPDVIAQIEAGGCGAIAAQYIEFADEGKIVADWKVISSKDTAEAFARSIESAPRTLDSEVGALTGHAAAMEMAAQEILTNDYEANWRVVDVSSDGILTDGGPPSVVRDKYTQGPIWEQITFNGLPLLKKSRMSEDLEAYFRRAIVGGPRSFLADPVSMGGLGEAIIRKLQAEIG